MFLTSFLILLKLRLPNFGFFIGMILHFRQTHMVPDQNYGKALGCDICDAFLVINGFSSYDELESHTAKIHGPVCFHFKFPPFSLTYSCLIGPMKMRTL